MLPPSQNEDPITTTACKKDPPFRNGQKIPPPTWYFLLTTARVTSNTHSPLCKNTQENPPRGNGPPHDTSGTLARKKAPFAIQWKKIFEKNPPPYI